MLGDIGSLFAFGPTDDFKLHRIALIEAFVSLTLNGGMMHKHIIAASLGGDKSITLLIIEPLHSTFWHIDIPFS